jgi:predicted acyl esterase
MRGFHGSEGFKMPFETDGWGELQDGYDTVEWIVKQNWSDGKVGTWGGSALGITQNMLAGSHPPSLLAQHIIAGASDMYSQMFFQGGVLRKAMVETWYGAQGALDRLADLLSHSAYDERWDLMNSERRVAGMEYPALHLGGWYDIFSQGTINAFAERQYNGGAGSLGNQKMVMGPWWHGGFGTTAQGDLVYPKNSAYGLWPDTIKLYDYWIKGIDNGFTEIPAVRYYVMGDVDDPGAPGNEWRSSDRWPVPSSNLSLYLSGDRLAPTVGQDLTRSYSYDPSDPVPTIGGSNLVLAAGPMDQRPIEGRGDVLVFSTEPLEVPVEVTGRIFLQLYASSSCPDTDFMVRLTDVYPDGRSILVQDGAIRARHRNSLQAEEFMDPGEVYEFWVDLWSTSIVFNRGHRIRLSVTSSNFPRFDANPNTGLPFRSSDETRVADNTVHMGSAYPSRLILPVAGPDADQDGVYDIFDPFPDESGPIPSAEELSRRHADLDVQIATIAGAHLRNALVNASRAAGLRLEKGDQAGAGHLLSIIDAAIGYDPGNISGPEAMRVVDDALQRALAMSRAGMFQEMLVCIKAGWTLGTLRQEMGTGGAAPVLDKYFLEAESSMEESGCGTGLLLAEWLRRDDVQSIATRIQLARLQGIPEGDLAILEGMLGSSKDQYLRWLLPGSESMLVTLRVRLDDMGIPVPELVIPLVGILSCWLLLWGRNRAP